MESNVVRELSKSIQSRILKSSFWPKSGRVGLYSPVKNEVMTQTLFQKALEDGLHVYFPRVEQGIRFYEVNGPDDLQRGSWSIPEPKIATCRPLGDDKLDLLLIPGIIFSETGYRVGYGRGFYDRYIAEAKINGPIIGMAYDFQVVDTLTPDEWDQPLHGVVTEKRLISLDPQDKV